VPERIFRTHFIYIRPNLGLGTTNLPEMDLFCDPPDALWCDFYALTGAKLLF